MALIGETVRGASAGDSEAWLVDGDVLTADPHRKRRVGSGQCVPVAFEAPLQGRLLVASDGLFGYAREVDIRDAARIRDLERAGGARPPPQISWTIWPWCCSRADPGCD